VTFLKMKRHLSHQPTYTAPNTAQLSNLTCYER